MLLAIALFLNLGMWQISRLAWKEELVATRKSALESQPGTDIPSALQSHQLLKVNISGTLLSPHIHLYSTGNHQRVHPLLMNNGDIIYVILGTENPISSPSQVSLSTPLKDLTVLLHQPPRKNLFTPANHVEKNQWYHLSVTDLDLAFGTKGLPFIGTALSPVFPTLSPLTPDQFLNLPNHHLMYAITWFSLAFVIGVLIMFYWGRGIHEKRLSKA